MVTEYTPEKVADLIADTRDHADYMRRVWGDMDSLMLEAADALTAVSAERAVSTRRSRKRWQNPRTRKQTASSVPHSTRKDRPMSDYTPEMMLPTKKHHPVGAYFPLGQLDGDCSCGDGEWPCAALDKEGQTDEQ